MARGRSRSSPAVQRRSQHKKRRRRVRKRRSVSQSPGNASFEAASRSQSDPGARSRSPSRYGAPMRATFGGRDSPLRRSHSPRRRQSRSGRHMDSSRRRRKSRSPSKSRADSPVDRRPWIEREKGGVKLFIGRLPREVSQDKLRECFEEFGDVLEVFIIASQAQSGVGCAFVRMSKLEDAEKAIEDLHEQRVLVPEQREMGPMQVAFAKGEAIRLGLNEKEEILPSFREARQKVVEHQEKRVFFEEMQKQQDIHVQVMQHQQAVVQQQQMMAEQVLKMSASDLVSVVKDGQRFGGTPFKQRWWSYCDQGWGGTKDYDPTHHVQEHLAHFVGMATCEYGHESWFRKHFDDLPPLPPLPPVPPGGPPPGAPVPGPGPVPIPFGPPGVLPPGMPPMFPPLGPPPGFLPPGAPPMMPPGPGGLPFPPRPMGLPPGGPTGRPFPGLGGPPGDRDRGRRRGPPNGNVAAAGPPASKPPPVAEDRGAAAKDDDSASSGSGSEADLAEVNMDDI